jgi:hypothetical protein
MVKKRHDCHLLLAGGGATDDPEGAEVLKEVQEAAASDPDIHVLLLPPFSDLEINALVRGSTVVIQKSLREGFGLTVSEALWKKKPVVAGAVGGIKIQVIDGVTGFLVHSIEGAATQIAQLLRDRRLRERMGENGYEHVKQNFLLTRHVKEYMLAMLAMEHPGESVVHLICAESEYSTLSRTLERRNGRYIDDVFHRTSPGKIICRFSQSLKYRSNGTGACQPFHQFVADVSGLKIRKYQRIGPTLQGASRSLRLSDIRYQCGIHLEFAVDCKLRRARFHGGNGFANSIN